MSIKKIAGYSIIAVIAILFAWVECQIYGVKAFFSALLILVIIVAALFFAMDLIES
jgi:uncharacterized membrane protein YccC